MISVREVRDKDIWESFLKEKNEKEYSGGIFLQAWSWGDFQESLSKKVFRLGVFNGEDLVGVCLFILQKAKISSFLYSPVGPQITSWKKEYLQELFKTAVDIGKKENCDFIRIEPRVLNQEQTNLLSNLGLVKAPEYTQPQCTAVIDLTKSEEQLLSAMSSSTRNNIGASQRKGVIVREGRPEEITSFTELLKQTANRKILTLPTEEDYHKLQFQILNKENQMKLFIAEFEEKTVSAALVVFYGQTAYYLHAANSLEMKNLRASYPLVWHTIKRSKEKGHKLFDFWGIAKDESLRDPWSGVTIFKLSFGAQRVCFSPPFDLPLTKGYLLSKAVETWRKPVRKIFRFHH